jgi:hypothetical protein
MGQRAIRSWISRHSYHSAEQTVKNKKLDHRVDSSPKPQSPQGQRLSELPNGCRCHTGGMCILSGGGCRYKKLSFLLETLTCILHPQRRLPSGRGDPAFGPTTAGKLLVVYLRRGLFDGRVGRVLQPWLRELRLQEQHGAPLRRSRTPSAAVCLDRATPRYA